MFSCLGVSVYHPCRDLLTPQDSQVTTILLGQAVLLQIELGAQPQSPTGPAGINFGAHVGHLMTHGAQVLLQVGHVQPCCSGRPAMPPLQG